MKHTSLVFASFGLLLAILLAGWWSTRGPEVTSITPTISGEPEYCISCHQDLPEISPSHPVEAFGCVSCHGGERLALDEDLAHSSMRGGANPSDLAVVEQSCGGNDCHSGAAGDQRDHIQRVETSLQATYAGAIAAMRYTYGAQPDAAARTGVNAVEDPHSGTGILRLEQFIPAQEVSPQLQLFSENCLYCHLSAKPMEGEEYHRYTGCSSCHTPTAGIGGEQVVHSLTTAIPYTQCNTCHNRGNYDLREMAFHPRSDNPGDRMHDYYQPIAQYTRCEWTLDCIDCHTRTEVMGDGDLHSSQSEAQYVQCLDCHGTAEELPRTYTITDPEDIAMRLAFFHPVSDLKVGDTILVTSLGEPLWNTRVLPDGGYELFGKASGQRFTFQAAAGTSCEQNPTEQESRYCHECHAEEH